MEKTIKIIHHINILMDRYHTIILLDIEKAFDKSQHPSMIKKKPLQRDWGWTQYTST